MKYVFFGTPEVAMETLQELHANFGAPLLVVTNPDAPKGRGRVMTSSPVKVWAEREGVEVITPEKFDDEVIKKISSVGASLGIVVAYGKILPESLIESFPHGVLNVHYSLLPRWRGAAPVEYSLLNNENVTGVTVQKMVKELDAGDVVASKEIVVSTEDTTATLRPRLIKVGSELLLITLHDYLEGKLMPQSQDPLAVTYAPKLKKEDGLLNLEADAQENWNKYRAYAVWPGTYFFENGKRIKIKRARFDNGRFIVERVVPEGGKEIDYVGLTED